MCWKLIKHSAFLDFWTSTSEENTKVNSYTLALPILMANIYWSLALCQTCFEVFSACSLSKSSRWYTEWLIQGRTSDTWDSWVWTQVICLQSPCSKPLGHTSPLLSLETSTLQNRRHFKHKWGNGKYTSARLLRGWWWWDVDESPWFFLLLPLHCGLL